jgi:multidrug resistance efflux pump
MAPEVAGRIVELPVKDNQFVHKGDLLMVIDPTDYKMAVSLNEAAVQQAQANAQNADGDRESGQLLPSLPLPLSLAKIACPNAAPSRCALNERPISSLISAPSWRGFRLF